jgi:hypothetical protein
LILPGINQVKCGYVDKKHLTRRIRHENIDPEKLWEKQNTG